MRGPAEQVLAELDVKVAAAGSCPLPALPVCGLFESGDMVSGPLPRPLPVDVPAPR